jgi:hypothetical protein
MLRDLLRGDDRAKELLDDAVERGDEVWSVTVMRTEPLAVMRKGEEGPSAHRRLASSGWT